MFLEPRGRQKEPGCPVVGGFWTAQTSAIHSTKIPTGPTGKSGPPQKVDPFFRNFSGWTEQIHLIFGPIFPEILVEWIAPHINVACEQALCFPSPHPARLRACSQANINVPAQLYKTSGQAKALINQLNRLEQEKYLKLFQLLCLEVTKIN